jgi:tetratricopeptide (TPR) repeat protein
MAFSIVWASTRIVIATFHLQSCRDSENLPKTDFDNSLLLSWKTLKSTLIIAVILCVFIFIAIPQYQSYRTSARQTEVSATSSSASEKSTEQKYLSDEELFGKNQATTKSNYFDQFDKEPVAEQVPAPSHAVANPGNDKATEEHFNTIRKEIPGFDQIVASGELVSWIDRQPSPIREQYKKVAESGTASEVIELLNRYKSNQKVAASPEQELISSNEWLTKAAELEKKEDWPGLLNHALRWTKALPKDAGAWYNLGIAYWQSNQPAKAIEAYQQALRINPEHANAWYNLGIAYKNSGQTSQVMDVYKRLKTLNPAVADNFLNKVVMP